MVKGDQDLIKRTNLQRIIEEIQNNAPISRASISKITGLSRSTCSILVDELLAGGQILEAGKAESTGGRKGILLTPNYENTRVIGIKIQRHNIFGALVDLRGKAILEDSIHGPEFETEEGLLSSLVDLSTRMIGKAGEHTRVVGIGIGIGGKIDMASGVMIESSILPFRNIRIKEHMEHHLSIPVFLENDVNAFAIGEKKFGYGKEYTNFLCVSLGQGIGLGVVLENEVYRGSHNGAGEFGHIRITDRIDSLTCTCGKTGCLEAYASERGIEQGYAALCGVEAPIREVLQRAIEGEPAALQAFTRAGEYLGIGLATLINLFDPEAILIGGEGCSYYRFMESGVLERIHENTAYGQDNSIRIHPVDTGEQLWTRGVAALVGTHFFNMRTGE